MWRRSLTESVTVNAICRRHRFAEHLWDNDIRDPHGLSLSGRI